MLGFKIFDRDDDELLNNLFLLAQKDNLSLEIALYDNNIVDFTKRMLNNSLYLSNPNKSIHLHYNKYVVNNIHDEKHYNNMLLELSQAKALQLNRGVIHYQYPPNYPIHLENLTPESLKKNLSLLNKIALSHDFIFYIENTYIFQRKHVINDLPNHRIIWDTILELGFEKNIGFCLDWGHVKAFSNDKLIDWIDFAKYLKLKGMPIYMHIHDNDGIKDLHCSLKEGKELNLDNLNKAKDLPFLETLKNVKDFFGNDSLILEYKSNIAEEHYNWTKNNIA